MDLVTPEAIGLGVAIPIVIGIVADLKPILTAAFPRVFGGVSAPWGAVARIVAIAYVALLWASGVAPAWLGNGWAVLLAGVGLGHAAGMARDGAISIPGAIGARASPPPDNGPPPGLYREPGA